MEGHRPVPASASEAAIDLMKHIILVLAMLAAAVLPLASCAAVTQPSMGVDLTAFRHDADDPAVAQIWLTALEKPRQGGEAIAPPRALFISGGGANGAFGGGLLLGWTRSGRRPSFDVVTGVSAGALIAPFAFLGPAWDAELERAIIEPKLSSLLRLNGLASLTRPGFYNPGPLRAFVAEFVTDRLLDAIAAEHARGRRLLVATTSLTTQRREIWDLGAIASTPSASRRQLFIDILVASASVPVLFPPQPIPEPIRDAPHPEPQVDGGITGHLLTIPQTMWLPQAPIPDLRTAEFFVIINGHIDPSQQAYPTGPRSYLSDTYAAMSLSSYRIELAMTRAFCNRNGVSLKVAQIASAGDDAMLDFSQPHLRRLFDLGSAAGESDEVWQ